MSNPSAPDSDFLAMIADAQAMTAFHSASGASDPSALNSYVSATPAPDSYVSATSAPHSDFLAMMADSRAMTAFHSASSSARGDIYDLSGGITREAAEVAAAASAAAPVALPPSSVPIWGAHSHPGNRNLRPPPRTPKKRRAEWSKPDWAYGDRDTPLPPEERLTTRQFYEKFVQRTQEQCDAEEMEPQGSEGWQKSRGNSATASRYGQSVGMSSNKTPDELAIEMLWPPPHDSINRDPMEWGTTNEPLARDDYAGWALQQLRDEYVRLGKDPDLAWLRVVERGVIRYSDTSWMAVSPDGIVEWRDPVTGHTRRRYLEIKCPYYLYHSETHPYEKYADNLPPEYKCQIQGGMGYLRMEDDRRRSRGELPVWEIEDADFVVWTPKRFWVSRFPFDQHFFENDMYPKLQSWFFTLFLPAATAKYNRLLIPGTLCKRTNFGSDPPALDLGDDDDDDHDT